MKMEEQKQVKDWREDVSEPKDVLKVSPDSSVIVTFLDEGIQHTHPEYGTSIVFGVQTEPSEEQKLWYVKNNNFSLLGQIKGLGELTGLKVKISRKGSKRSDTRYTISKI